jgi:drug/metabolite transporter (DMT)-like permease
VNQVRGTLLAFAAFAAMAWGDGFVKSIGTRLSVFEIGLIFLAGSGIATYFMRPPDERWRDMFKMRHPWLTQLRALTGFGAGILGVFAFTTIPFAEAYSLIFLAPFIVMVAAILLLGERPNWLGWLALAGGVAGVLLVVRPGLRGMELGHLSAFGAALCIAGTVTILRRIASTEKRTSILGVPPLYALVGNAILAASTFVVPTVLDAAVIVVAGLLGAAGQLLLLSASRQAPAFVISQAQYSQLIWAALIGAIFFREYPDGFALIGLAIIIAAGLATVGASRLDQRRAAK